MPALAGAMAPEWNADARAGWFGLTAAHGRAHLARALLEGNAYALRDVLEAMGAAGLTPTELVCVAGGARGGLLRQIRADVTGLPVTRPYDVETTARGAAMLAAVGCGAASRCAHRQPDDGRAARRARLPRPGAARALRRAARAPPGALLRASPPVLGGTHGLARR